MIKPLTSTPKKDRVAGAPPTPGSTEPPTTSAADGGPSATAAASADAGAAAPDTPLAAADGSGLVVVERAVADLRLHPDAEKIPRMRDAEREGMLADVREHGVLEPIVVQRGGVILDGRQRWEAARERGDATIPTREVDLSEDEQRDWVYRSALLRRQLSDDQRAVLAAKWREPKSVLVRRSRAVKAGAAGGRARTGGKDSLQDGVSPKLSGGPTKRSSTRQAAAQQFNVSERKVRAAIEVHKSRPDLADRVQAGELRLPEAKRMAGATTGATDPGTRPAISRQPKSRKHSTQQGQGALGGPDQGMTAPTSGGGDQEAGAAPETSQPSGITLELPQEPAALAPALAGALYERLGAEAALTVLDAARQWVVSKQGEIAVTVLCP